jgi:hypothetical protein
MVNQIVGHGRRDLHLQVGGLISATEEHVVWRKVQLKVGDEVTLRIVEAGRVDRPKKRYRMDSTEHEKNTKAYCLAAAKKYGWKLITSLNK